MGLNSQHDLRWWRENEFAITENSIYLDHAAMSPLPKRVLNSVQDFHILRQQKGPNFTGFWHNVEEVRGKIAALIGGEADEIAFVPNTSTGLNIAAQGLPLESGQNVIISDIEFPSNVYPWLNLKHKNIETRFVPNQKGAIPVSEIEKLIDSRTKVISLSFVEAGNGYINDLKQLSKLCKERNIYFVVDAIQGLGVQPLDVKELQIDILTSGFFKWLFGPDGIGFVYCSQEILADLKPVFVSWTGMNDKFNYTDYNFKFHTSARCLEVGNMNFSAIKGVGTALDLIQEIGLLKINQRVMELSAYLREGLASIRGARCLSEFPVANRSQITLVGCDKVDDVFSCLQKQNIIVNKRQGLRVSPHFYNTKAEIDSLLEVLDHSINSLRS
jgi:selenocysteine lyase/cysteine desulfurase